MRMLPLLAASVLVCLPVIAQAQSTGTESPASPLPAPNAQQSTPQIQRVMVVDFDSLPPPLQMRVSEAIAAISEDDLRALRASIDATPEVAGALKAKGMNSGEVVATSLDEDGALTLIIKRAV